MLPHTQHICSGTVVQRCNTPGSQWSCRTDGVPKERESATALLCPLPVDGVIKLLHLLVAEDAVGEVRLELLQGQLPVI